MNGVDLTKVHLTVDDIRLAGFCGSGAGDWFRSHGMSLTHFKKHGMSAAEFLEASGHDAHAVMLIGDRLDRDRAGGKIS